MVGEDCSVGNHQKDGRGEEGEREAERERRSNGKWLASWWPHQPRDPIFSD